MRLSPEDHAKFNTRWAEDKYSRVIRSRDDLHRFQRKGVRFLKRNPFSALFVDVGMGKSVMSLTLLADLMAEGWNGRALVIAPLRVARSTWPEEIAEWKQAAGIEHTLLRAEDDDEDIKAIYKADFAKFYAAEIAVGEKPKDARRFAASKAGKLRTEHKKRKRERLALEVTTLHIINIEQFVWLVEFWEEQGRTTGKKWPYGVVFVDEASKFKEANTKRWKALNKARSRIHRLHLLTASPAAEGYEGLFALMFLLDRGKRLGRSMHSYHAAHFNEIPQARKHVLRKGHDKRIGDKISDMCLVMKSADHRDELQVEDWQPIRRRIILPPDMKQRYDDFERSFILELPDQIIEALNSAALFNKLLQLSAGAVYDAEKKVVPIHDEKIEDLRELVDELQGTPLMVSYWFKSSLARLRKAFPKAVVMDRNARCKDAWNRGEIDMLLIQPGSAAHGLNLQKGPGHDLAIFDPFYSRELYEQLIGRLARQGQKDVVRVHQQTCVGTADEYVYECLEDKDRGQQRLFKYIRAARARFERTKNGIA